MTQADVPMLDLGTQGLTQSLLELIQPLRTVLQAYPGMRALQPVSQVGQQLGRRAQFAPPGLHQALAHAAQRT